MLYKKNIFLKKGNVLRTIFKETVIYDLIYSSGLFDYFSMEASAKLLMRLWNLLSDKGTLFITNANSENKTRLWMEYAQTGTYHTKASERC